MKKTVLNGQVLSEKEMKEVKGGHYNENISDPHAEDLVCEECGNELSGKFVYDPNTRLYACFCSVCGAKVTKEPTMFEADL